MYGKHAINIKYHLYITYFMFYSFLGWLLETTFVSIQKHSLTIRGFLLGPFCPVYGFGAIFIILFSYLICKTTDEKLSNLKRKTILKYFLVFLQGVVITTIIELVTSIIMTSLTGERLWDYSNEFLNFYGIICLKISLIWGFLALLIVFFIQPRISCLVSRLSYRSCHVLANLLMVYLVTDTVASLSTVSGIKLIQSLLSFF